MYLPCRADQVTDMKLLCTKCLLWPKGIFLARVHKFFLPVFMLRVQHHDSVVCVYTEEPGSVYRHVRKILFCK